MRGTDPPAEELHSFALDTGVPSCPALPRVATNQSWEPRSQAPDGRTRPQANRWCVRGGAGLRRTRCGGGEAASCRDRAARASDVKEAWLAASQAGVCGTVRTRRPWAGAAGEPRRADGASWGFLRRPDLSGT